MDKEQNTIAWIERKNGGIVRIHLSDYFSREEASMIASAAAKKLGDDIEYEVVYFPMNEMFGGSDGSR